MNTVKSLLCASCALICFLAGCAGPTQYETVEQICAAHDALIVAERKLIADELLEKAERSAVSLKGKRLYSAEGIVMRKIADRLNKRTRH